MTNTTTLIPTEFVWVALDREWCRVPKSLASEKGWHYKSDVSEGFIKNIPLSPPDLAPGDKLSAKPVPVKFTEAVDQQLRAMGAGKQAFIRQAVAEKLKAKEQQSNG